MNCFALETTKANFKDLLLQIYKENRVQSKNCCCLSVGNEIYYKTNDKLFKGLLEAKQSAWAESITLSYHQMVSRKSNFRMNIRKDQSEIRILLCVEKMSSKVSSDVIRKSFLRCDGNVFQSGLKSINWYQNTLNYQDLNKMNHKSTYMWLNNLIFIWVRSSFLYNSELHN